MRTLRVNALPVFLVIVRLFIHPAIVRRAAGGRIGALRFVEFILGGLPGRTIFFLAATINRIFAGFDGKSAK
jgi:hypothetical protein